MDKISVSDAPFLFFCDNSMFGENEMFYSNSNIERNMGDDLLNKYFFSNKNVKFVNLLLQKFVFIKSGNRYKIPLQSEESITLVMTYIYEEHARHLPHEIQKQIEELNLKVISYLTPKLISRVEQDIYFQNELGKPLDPISLPIDTSRRKGLNLPAYIR